MAFVLKVPSPVARMEWYWASTTCTFKQDSLMQADMSASVNGGVPATATSLQILGSVQQAIASTDTNYTTQTTKIPVLVDELGIWEADVWTTTSTPTANYEMYKVDLFQSATSASCDYVTTGVTTQQFAVTNFVSAKKLQGKITSWFGTHAA